MPPSIAVDSQARAVDSQAFVDQFRADVVAGLSKRPRRLPCKYFYDERGSALFDRICELEEYYLTRTELSMMRAFAAEMAESIGPRACLVELGSGSSQKTRLLLDHLPDMVHYVPVDISREHLHHTTSNLSRSYPNLPMTPVCGDFTKVLPLPRSISHAARRVVYFPGSTIGNFRPPQAQKLLVRMARLARPGGGLLIGIDLVKERRLLEAAYNDRAGITAAFNLNLLLRINRELAGTFDLTNFRHVALYNHLRRRVEMYLVSACRQVVSVAGRRFRFAPQEKICTEHSHKYTIEDFTALAAANGLRSQRVWTDPRQWFAVVYLTVS